MVKLRASGLLSQRPGGGVRYPTSLTRFRYRIAAVDALAGFAAPVVALFLREPEFVFRLGGDALHSVAAYVISAAGATVLACAYFQTGQIVPKYLERNDVRRLLLASAVATLLGSFVSFLLTRLDVIPRSIPVLHFIALGSLLVGWRYAISTMQSREVEGPFPEKLSTMIIAGANEYAHLFLRTLAAIRPQRGRVVAIIDDDPKVRGRMIGGVPVLGSLAQADSIIHELRTHGVFVDRIVLAYPDDVRKAQAHQTLEKIRDKYGVELDSVSALPAILDHRPTDVAASPDQGSLEPGTLAYLRVRYVLEKALAALGLLLLSPLFGALALVVWKDVGRPILFWQDRIGINGRRILIHKFRTFKSPVRAGGGILNDAERVSGVGAFLRKTRLDELPQFFDVLRGDMSIIGPRPLLPVDIPKGSHIRQLIAPGLTGWAQVNGGNLITSEEKNALDEWYIHHAGARVDLIILLRTVRTVFMGESRMDSAITQAKLFRDQRSALFAERPPTRSSAVAAPTNAPEIPAG